MLSPQLLWPRRKRGAQLAPPIGIDRTNYFVTRGISAFWLLGFGRPLDVIGNFNQAIPVGTRSIFACSVGFGETGNSSSTNYWTVSNGPIIAGKANWSIVAGIFNPQASPTAAACIYSERATSGLDILTLGCFNNTLKLVCTYRNDAGTLVNPSTGKLLNAAFHVVGVSKTPANVIQYADGQKDVTTAWNTNDNFTNAGVSTWIGNTQQGTSTSAWGGGLLFVGIFPWALTTVDHFAFAADPWQFLIFPDDVVSAQQGGGSASFIRSPIIHAPMTIPAGMVIPTAVASHTLTALIKNKIMTRRRAFQYIKWNE